MAYVSRLEGGYGTGVSVIHNDSAHDSVLVPDAGLLLSGVYHRSGPDLVIIGSDGRHHIIAGYFSSEHPQALIAPNGMSLSGATVELMAGSPTPGQYAQAQPAPASGDAIGKVEKSVGDVTAIRNGVSVILNVGDAVYKSDVVQTGTASSVGISFPDGTALNLVANTRMALNDYSYTPSSNSNDALFTLVEGTFAFVAGKVAHTGDMKINTPVATMGIRGTTGVVEQELGTINATQNGVTYSFLLSADFGTGLAGLYDLTDAQGNVIATVSQTGYVTYLTPQGPGQTPLVSVAPITNSQFAVEQEILQQLFQTLNPVNQQNNNNNGSSSPPPPPQSPLQQLIENGPATITIPGNGPGNNPITITTTTHASVPGPTPIVFFVNSSGGSWENPGNWSDGFVPTSFSVVEILIPVTVTVSQPETSNGLVLYSGAVLEIESGASVQVNTAIIGAGSVELNASGSDPELIINGSVSLVGETQLQPDGSKIILPGGTILLAGSPSSDDLIVGFASVKTPAVLDNVNFTIMGAGQIGRGDGNLTLINETGGVIDASGGALVIDTGNQVANAGLVEATAGGTLQLIDSVSNTGTVEATGVAALVKMANATLDNLGNVLASTHGAITFTGVTFTNEAGNTVEATLAGAIAFSGGTVANANSIQADNSGAVTFSGAAVTNLSGAIIIATSGGTVTFNGGSVINGGTIEAIAGGILQVESFTLQNSSTFTVDGTSTLDLDSATIAGGVIGNAGNVVVAGTSEIDGATVTNSGTVTVGAGASLTLQATASLTNAGTVDAVSGGAATINLNNAADSNSGTIKADGGAVTVNINKSIDANDGTIEALNGGSVTLKTNSNGSSNHGLIEATSGGTVTVEGSDHGGGGNGGNSGNGSGGSGGGGNYGTIEATAGGQVSLNVGLDNYGLVEAVAAGTIDFMEGDDRNHAGGVVQSSGAGSLVEFNNGNLDNSNQIIAENGGAISLSSVLLTNESGATFESSGAGSTISYNTGGVTNDTGATIEADNGGAITFNGSIGISNEGGTIEALSGGSIAFKTTGTGSVSNDGGTIEASGAQSSVTFDASLNGAQNDAGGVIEALAGGTVTIDGFQHGNALSNTKGTIAADGAGSTVKLAGATIIGGTLKTTNSGTIEVASGVNLFSGGTISTGAVKLDNGTKLTLDNDAVTNTSFTSAAGAIIAIDASDTLTLTGVTIVGGELDVAAGATLNLYNTTLVDVVIKDLGTINVYGSSTVDSFGSVYSGQTTVASGQTLFLDNAFVTGNVTNNGTLQVDTTYKAAFDAVTISGGVIAINGTVTSTGTSSISDAAISIGVNGELVAAGGTLTIDPSSISNSGLLEATNGATLDLASVVTNTGTGEIEALGSGSVVQISANVSGGALIANGGVITLTGVTLDNVTLSDSSGGSFIDGGTETIVGTVTLDGATIINTNATIADTGTLLVSADSTIDNGTINGGGNLTASGAILTLAGVTLDNVTLGGSFTNSGTLTAKDTVTLNGAIITGGSITDSGTIAVTASGGTLAGTAVTGGKLIATAGTMTLSTDTLDNVTLAGSFTNVGTLTTKDTVTLNGATITGGAIADSGTIVVTANNGMLASAAVTGGTLTATAGTMTLSTDTLDNVTLAGSFTNVGTLTAKDVVTLNGAAITGGTIADSGTIAVSASGGTIASATVTGGNLAATAGTMTLSTDTLDNVTLAGSFTNSGTLTVDDTVTLNGAAITGGAITDNGTIAVSASGGTIASATVTGGNLTATAGTITLSTDTLDNVTLAGSFTNSSTLIAQGTETLDGATITGGTITDSGTIAVTANNGTLASTTSTGGNLRATAGTMTLSGDTLSGVTLAGNNFTNVGTLIANGTETLNSATITGGSITDNGTIAVTASGGTLASATVTGGKLMATAGTMTLSTDTLDNVTLAGSFTIVGTLTAQGTETLNSATITGGTVMVAGTLDAAGTSAIDAATLTNNGTIDATGVLVLDTGNIVTNAGLLEATGTGELDVQDATIANTGTGNNGIAVASGAELLVDSNALTLNGGGAVALSGTITGKANTDQLINTNNVITGSGTISNLTLTNQAGGTINGTGVLILATGKTITNAGLLEATGTGVLDVRDSTIANSGTGLAGMAIAMGAELLVDMVGGGTLTLNGAGAMALNGGSIIANVSGETLENNGNTISGFGQIGDGTTGDLTLDNNAGTIEASGGTLKLITNQQIANAGTLEANGAKLVIASNVQNSGEILATGGGILDLTGVGVSWTGAAPAAGTNGIVLAGATDKLLIDAAASANFTVKFNGTGGGHGAISLNGGTISNNGANANAETLNNVNNVIVGFGTIKTDNTNGGSLTLDNSGSAALVEASGGTLTVSTGKTITNAGVLQAGGAESGTLIIDDSVSNSGHINAVADGTLTLSGATITNSSGGDINLDASTAVLNLTDENVSGGAINNSDGGSVNVSGVSLLEGAATVYGGALSIGGNATLEIESGSATLSGVVVANSGTIQVDGQQSPTVTLYLTSGASITGGFLTQGGTSGVLDIGAGGATLDDVSVANGIAITVESSDTLTVNGGTSITGSSAISNSGVIAVNGGTFTVASGATFNGGGSVQISGGATADFLGAFNENVTFSGNGTLELSYAYTGTISGFTVGDAIDLHDISFTSGEYDIWTPGAVNSTLAVYSATGTLERSLTLSGNTYSQTDFTLTQDSGTGTEVTYLAQPVLTGQTAQTVNEGSTNVTLGVNDGATGTVTISGLPTDLSNVSGGTYTAAAGTWTGSAADFNALSFTAGDEGSFHLLISEASGVQPVTSDEPYTLTVTDAALAAAGNAISGTEGASLTAAVAIFTDANPNALASDFTATINWGDNTSSTGTVVALNGGGFAVDGTHTYAEEGTYNSTVTINDHGGSTATVSEAVTVADAALSATATAIAPTEGKSTGLVQVASFTDADPNGTISDFTATINWGDGNTTNGTVVALNGGGFAVDGSHTYAATGTYNSTVTINDNGGSTATASETVTVNRPANSGAVVYMTDTSDPWGVKNVAGSAEYAMNQAFGTSNWTADYGYSTAPFTSGAKFIYLEGGDGDSTDFFNFVSANLNVIENYVANGGHLFINSASWTGGNINLGNGIYDENVGFGAYLEFNTGYSVASATGHAVNADNPIFTNAGTSWSGNYFSHDIITGSGFQTLITGSSGTVVAEENYGSGDVVIGGITFPWFWSPSPQAENLLANILVYASGSPSEVVASSIHVGAGATVDVPAPSNAAITFDGNTGTLVLDQPTTFSGEIYGIAGRGDVLDLSGFNSAHTTATVGAYANGITALTVTDNEHSVTLALEGDYTANSFSIQSDGKGGVNVFDPPAVTSSIENGGSLIVNSPSSEAIQFNGGTGTLVLDQASTFTGQIEGFTGTAPDAAHSDVIDLAGVNFDSGHFSDTYNASTGVLTVNDGTASANLTFDNFTKTFEFASDGHGGTDIFDPPTQSSDKGSQTGQSQVGSGEIGHGMDFGHDQIAWTQNGKPVGNNAPANNAPSGNGSVTVGGTDHFVFQPVNWTSGNHDTSANAPSPGQSDDHANANNAQLASILTHDPVFDQVFDAAHNDGAAITAQFHQIVASAGHLH